MMARLANAVVVLAGVPWRGEVERTRARSAAIDPAIRRISCGETLRMARQIHAIISA